MAIDPMKCMAHTYDRGVCSTSKLLIVEIACSPLRVPEPDVGMPYARDSTLDATAQQCDRLRNLNTTSAL